ncbi:unnamed protein product [Oppiella nova]|uniref:Phospholipid scramblase n=1 Tax=Oppiella nova TaxID=334625 RepID=A0A7R9MFD7_9ACAR|nr:unnamed protein product [Oppiella nova]CAG2176377.1 unnamed protein product [Oppiella nova]
MGVTLMNYQYDTAMAIITTSNLLMFMVSPQSFAPVANPTADCPPGLEYLLTIDQILVHQKIELCEILCGCETNNKYEIKNSLGQKIYYAKEDTDCCTRHWCGPIRPFDLKILDNNRREVIHLYRPLRCDGCCFWCCLQRLDVLSPCGEILGTIRQEWSLCLPKFRVEDANGECVLMIRAPFCVASWTCGDIDFPIYSAYDDSPVGKITKQWSGLGRELFTDADHFGITFPMDLDVHIKAVLLGACFLIDFLFYERKQ